jgi:ADP-L-glycero-D-manno-heptose 6-epimerase
MSILVTGAAGFIGSQIIKALNKEGHRDIVAVDNLTKAEKFANLADVTISDYLDKGSLLQILEGHSLGFIEAVFHQGACSDTTESDGRYMMENNFRFSRLLLDWCIEHKKPIVYASSAAVYGSGKAGFREEPACDKPLNVYGYSKFLFDHHVRGLIGQTNVPIVGLRYFNVYGPGEGHKGRMASVARHHFHQMQTNGKVRLFEGTDGYGPGGQKRDFVYVEDVVKVNLWALHDPRPGIYNVGTGRAQEFNDVASSTVNSLRRREGKDPLSLAQMVDQGILEYIPFPQDLKGKYQSFTEADLTHLRNAGYSHEFQSVEQGVANYVDHLSS